MKNGNVEGNTWRPLTHGEHGKQQRPNRTMTQTLEEQLIDNENRVALMAAIIYAGLAANPTISVNKISENARFCIDVAEAIIKEVGKEAEKIRSEL